MHFDEARNELKISHSDFEAFAKCELMWVRNQDISIVREPAAPLICGSAFHATVEAIIRGSREKGLIQMYLQAELLKNGLEKIEDFREKYPKLVEKIVEFRDGYGQQLVDLFQKKVLPKLQPESVEYWAKRELFRGHDGRSYCLNCRVDYLDQRGFICDWKTTSQSPASAKIERGHLMQARINLFCDERQDFRFIYFGGSGKSPAVYRQEVLLEDDLQDASDLRWQLEPMIYRMEELLLCGVDPLPTGSYTTAYAEGQCDYCDYRHMCRHGACRMTAGGKIE